MGKISPAEYKEKIKELRLFLNGKYKSLYAVWEQEMKEASKNTEFEKAAQIRDRLINLDRLQNKITIRELKPGRFNCIN